MNARLLALLAVLGALLLAGCTFKAESDDDDSDSGTTLSAGDGDDDDKDSPSAGLWMVLSVVGMAAVLRRRSA